MSFNDPQQPLSLRCLALTGAFETSVAPPGCFGCVTGDFDGMGISYSALQWNLGQGTLQSLLSEMNVNYASVMTTVFGAVYQDLTGMLAMPRPQQLTWARSIQSPQHKLNDPWHKSFQALGQTAEFQTIASNHAAGLFTAALALCKAYGLTSQRAAALMFDIKVQNGNIPSSAGTLIQQDFQSIAPGDPAAVETARLCSVANRIADTAGPKWREDVRTRKLTVANGNGVVHGVHYDLAAQYGLTMSPF